MNFRQKIFLSFAFFFTFAFYLSVLGDVGVIKRKLATKEYLNLQNKLSLLQIENSYLNDQYNLILKSPSFLMKTNNKNLNPKITIIKFEDENVIQTDVVSYITKDEDRLTEIRLLYFFSIFFIIIISLWFLKTPNI